MNLEQLALTLFAFLWIMPDFIHSNKKIRIKKVRKTGPIADWLNTTDDPSNYDDYVGKQRIVCSQQQFSKLFECCKKKKEVFLTGRSIAKCNKNDEPHLNNFLTEYVLHKYQSVAKNTINLKAPNIKHSLGPAMCFIECIFRKEKLIYRSKTINYDKVMNKFIAANPSVVPLRMEEIINECRLNVEDLPLVTVKAPINKCLTRPLLLLQCLRKQFIFECPRNLTVDTIQCNQGKVNLRQCEIV